jgi:hypothetical protein
MLAIRRGSVIRICAMQDLRPYYIEVLDRDRFRAAVPEDGRILSEFVQMFCNRR